MMGGAIESITLQRPVLDRFWCCVCTRDLEQQFHCFGVAGFIVWLGTAVANVLLASSFTFPDLLVVAIVLESIFFVAGLATASHFGSYMCGNAVTTYFIVGLDMLFTFIFVLVAGSPNGIAYRNVAWMLVAKFCSVMVMWLLLMTTQSDGKQQHDRNRGGIVLFTFCVIMLNVAEAPSFAWLPSAQHYILVAVAGVGVICGTTALFVKGVLIFWPKSKEGDDISNAADIYDDQFLFFVAFCWQLAAIAVLISDLVEYPGIGNGAKERFAIHIFQVFPACLTIIALVCRMVWWLWKCTPSCCSDACETIDAAILRAKMRQEYESV